MRSDLRNSWKRKIIRQSAHFGDLGALKQLPDLQSETYGKKAMDSVQKSDWKTAAMVRLMKIMTAKKKDAKGTSMMEDLHI